MKRTRSGMSSSIKNWMNNKKAGIPLVRVPVDETFNYREEQDLDVQHHRPVFNIIQITVDAQPDRSVTAVAIDLCPACDAGTDLMLDHVTGDFFLKLLYEKWALRPRADETHLPF